MKMSPDEIRNLQFKKSFHGYDAGTIDQFLADLAADLEAEDAFQKTRTEKILELETQVKDYRSMEKMIQQTLMQAQESSAKAIENARREAELVAQQTKMKVTETLDKARKELSSLKEQISIHLAKKDSIIMRLKMLLSSELDLIKAMESDSELKQVETRNQSDTSEIDDIIKNL
jgi:cell division initiation protein